MYGLMQPGIPGMPQFPSACVPLISRGLRLQCYDALLSVSGVEIEVVPRSLLLLSLLAKRCTAESESLPETTSRDDVVVDVRAVEELTGMCSPSCINTEK